MERFRNHDNDRQGGFSLLEVVFSLSALSMSVVSVGLGVHQGMQVSREIRDMETVQAQAQAFLDVLLAQSFGNVADPTPDPEQLDEIFDNDLEGGDVTLQQLTNWPPQNEGWVFSLANFPVTGVWRVQVDTDFNDDGAIAGGLEGRDDVLRVKVFFDGRLILSTNTATEAAS